MNKFNTVMTHFLPVNQLPNPDFSCKQNVLQKFDKNTFKPGMIKM